MKRIAFKGRRRQAGVAAVEFSLVAIIFFTLVFATLELARVEYLLNTLVEVTRRAATAAANVDYTDSTALERVRAYAVFRNSSGPLVLGEPVISDHVKIDYLWLSKADWDFKHMNTLPACPEGNRSNCMANPHADNCIRFVRARICASMDSEGNCERLPYQMVFPLLDLSKMNMPESETIVPAGNLGATLGSIPCT